MELWKLCLCLKIYGVTFLFLFFQVHATMNGRDYISAIGDPGMRRDGLRVAIESWNQCNEVGKEAPNMGSPRMADCFDVKYCEPQSKCPLKIKYVLFNYNYFQFPHIS